MLKSCSETFYAGGQKFIVKIRRKAIEIDILADDRPRTSAEVLTNHIRITDGSGNAITTNNPLPVVASTAVYTSSGTSWSNAAFQMQGYRLFMYKGYLKCVKREISDIYRYTLTSVSFSNAVTIPGTDKKKKSVHESLYEPAAIFGHILSTQDFDPLKDFVDDAVIALAADAGVHVPPHIRDFGLFFARENHRKNTPSQRSYASIDWLTYPLMRELDNPVISRNISHVDRRAMAPKFEPMNFKQLVQHYYGASTNKLLEEIWKVLAVGGDWKETRFTDDPGRERREYFFDHNPEPIVHSDEESVIQVANRRTQTLVFTVGPALFKSIGFDYLYQALPHFKVLTKGRMHEGMALDSRPKLIEENFKTLLKFMTPKKLISALFEESTAPDLHSLNDTVNMLTAYDSFEKIPESLQSQYPNGLKVDFKFKTMKELHDKVSVRYTTLKAEAKNRAIKTSFVYDLLDGREKNGLKLVVPRKSAQLAVWGTELSICIASYGDKAANGHTLLLGVEKDNQIKYCIEFYSRKIERNVMNMDLGISRVFEKDAPPDIAEAPTYERISEVHPMLKEMNAGVVPEDEDPIYFIPRQIQFRGLRNGDPDKKDREAVECLLNEWVAENREFFETFPDLFKEPNDGYSIEGIAVHNAINNVGQPDRIIMNPHQYNALHQALGNPPVEQFVNPQPFIGVDYGQEVRQPFMPPHYVNNADIANYANVNVNAVEPHLEPGQVRIAIPNANGMFQEGMQVNVYRN
jgi:PcfJ-like protein